MAFKVFRSDENGQWYWHLTAANGEIVAASEAYTRKEDAERGIEDAREAFESAPSTEGDDPQ